MLVDERNESNSVLKFETKRRKLVENLVVNILHPYSFLSSVMGQSVSFFALGVENFNFHVFSDLVNATLYAEVLMGN